MRRTMAAIALLGFISAASAAPADDNDPDRAILLGTMGEGTATIAAVAACDTDKASIERAIDAQTRLIRAAADGLR